MYSIVNCPWRVVGDDVDRAQALAGEHGQNVIAVMHRFDAYCIAFATGGLSRWEKMEPSSVFARLLALAVAYDGAPVVPADLVGGAWPDDARQLGAVAHVKWADGAFVVAPTGRTASCPGYPGEVPDESAAAPAESGESDVPPEATRFARSDDLE